MQESERHTNGFSFNDRLYIFQSEYFTTFSLKTPLFLEHNRYFYQKRGFFYQKIPKIIWIYEKNTYFCIE